MRTVFYCCESARRRRRPPRWGGRRKLFEWKVRIQHEVISHVRLLNPDDYIYSDSRVPYSENDSTATVLTIRCYIKKKKPTGIASGWFGQ